MKMRAWARYLIPLLMVASVGCASAPSAPPTVDVTGVWVGTWVTKNQTWNGPVKMTLVQKGADVTGDLVMRAGFGDLSGPVIRGFVSGNEYRLFLTTGRLSGYLTVSGDDMTGVVSRLTPMDMKLHRER
jgi:hypothetical protein